MALDPKKLSREEMERALQLLERDKIRREKIKRGELKSGRKWSELTEEEKEKRRKATRRRNARIRLMVQKATEQGITVTEEEIDAYMKEKEV
jgi:ClpP class serine protease